jgi:hypothetical protein
LGLVGRAFLFTTLKEFPTLDLGCHDITSFHQKTMQGIAEFFIMVAED